MQAGIELARQAAAAAVAKRYALITVSRTSQKKQQHLNTIPVLLSAKTCVTVKNQVLCMFSLNNKRHKIKL